MDNTTINFNEEDTLASYNSQTKQFEAELQAPNTGGILKAKITYTDIFGKEYEIEQDIQVLIKEPIKLELNKIFMWIFDYKDFAVKDILEITDYDINIDEETNANTIITVAEKTTAKEKDIVLIKKNNVFIFWGIIDNIENEDGKTSYQYTLKYITNLFDQKIPLANPELIKTTGIEDFIANAINTNFINNADTFINKNYLKVEVKTHTIKQVEVTNVTDGIYNLHTYMSNCTQLYNITYSFRVENKQFVITIENKELKKQLVDINAQAITNYKEVFEKTIVAKVVVLTKEEGTYTLYLKTDRTTTTDMNDENRAEGTVETVYTEKMEDAAQKALDTIQANRYNHMVSFSMADKEMQVGTPVVVKTKENNIYDTYISAVRYTSKSFTDYTCGLIRVDFIDKLLKERRK